MKNYHFTFLLSVVFLISCQEKPKSIDDTPSAQNIQDTINTEVLGTTLFLIDNCDSPYISVLERDITKGNDTCILRITSKEKGINRVEVLNVPVDKSSIQKCEEDYVSVSFACGGPCHSHIFVFTDEHRPNEQYAYVQYIEDYPNIIGYCENEEFEKLIVRNLNNGKEIIVENPDVNWMNYGKADTMYLRAMDLHLEYQTSDEQTKAKVLSLSGILNN